MNIISVGLFIRKVSSAPTAEAIMNEIAKRPKISDIPLDIVGNESANEEDEEEEAEAEAAPGEEEVEQEDAF